MKCVIPGVNIRVFGRAIHSLSKIGEELYVEPLEHGLALRTVNSSRSAYACFLFSPSFFQLYDDGIAELSSPESEEDTLRCKVGMKSCLTVFKSMSTIEKTVERCKVTMNVKEARLVFQLYCKHGIVKTHNLAFIECETLQAVFSKDMCVNKLTSSARLLSEAVVNFQNNQEEITLIATPDKISLKNYVDDEPDPNKVMHTVLNLDPSEFDSCRFGVDSEITFCLKELRAILAFAEITGMPLSIQFETAGRPVVFCIDSDSAFEANFVLATLADAESTSSSQQPQTSKSSLQNTKSGKTRVNKSSTNKQSSSYRTCGASETNGRNSGLKNHTQQSRDDKKPKRSERLETAYEELMDDDDFDDEIIMNDVTSITIETNKQDRVSQLAGGDNESRHRSTDSPRPSTSRSSMESPVIPNQSTYKPSVPDISVNEDLNYEEEDEPIPGTPPPKKFRSLFFGSSQASSQQTQSQRVLQTSMVLAEDTDDDDD